MYATVVWEKFDIKKISSLVWYDENWTHEIFLTMNKKVTFLFIGDSKRWKYFNTNKFHTKISNSEFFPNYGILYVCNIWRRLFINSFWGMHMFKLFDFLHVFSCILKSCIRTVYYTYISQIIWNTNSR